MPDYVWKELEYTVRSGLTPKGTLAAFDHTDHIGITVPNAGACYLQDHIVHQLAAKVNANVLTLDPQDFIFLAQRSFSRDGKKMDLRKNGTLFNDVFFLYNSCRVNAFTFSQ